SGDEAPVAAGATGPAQLAAAPPRRLLDPRGISELGHRLRLPPLASDEEARAQPAGAARDRDRPVARSMARRAGVGEVDLRPRPALLRAPARRRGPSRRLLRREHRPP